MRRIRRGLPDAIQLEDDGTLTLIFPESLNESITGEQREVMFHLERVGMKCLIETTTRTFLEPTQYTRGLAKGGSTRLNYKRLFKEDKRKYDSEKNSLARAAMEPRLFEYAAKAGEVFVPLPPLPEDPVHDSSHPQYNDQENMDKRVERVENGEVFVNESNVGTPEADELGDAMLKRMEERIAASLLEKKKKGDD